MLPVILGLQGTRLSQDEIAFFKECDPLGFILFARNIESPEQVKKLTSELRDCVGRTYLPILIDQEGGRVQRLKPPHWHNYPPMGVFGAVAQKDPTLAASALRVNCRLIADDLRKLGINVDCAPVLDVPQPGAHDVIGDRAFSRSPEMVGTLGRITLDAFHEGGILPIIKHIPGHGRAGVDSHKELPKVNVPASRLQETDFLPFSMMNDAPMAMTAHVLYEDIDPDNPATTSKIVIEKVIREMIGFSGLLIGDDLSMEALNGSLEDRAHQTMSAGCDVALHCSGDMAEMQSVVKGMAGFENDMAETFEGLLRPLALLPSPDRKDLEKRYNNLMQRVKDII